MDSVASWAILLVLAICGLWKLLEAIDHEETRRHELSEREWATTFTGCIDDAPYIKNAERYGTEYTDWWLGYADNNDDEEEEEEE